MVHGGLGGGCRAENSRVQALSLHGKWSLRICRLPVCVSGSAALCLVSQVPQRLLSGPTMRGLEQL